MRTRGALLACFGAALLLGCRCERKGATGYRKVDVHQHFAPVAADAAVAMMDRHGISLGVNLSGGFSGGGLEQQLAAASRHPGRIVVFCTPDWSLVLEGPGWGRRLAADLASSHRLGARGLKISKALGLFLRDGQGSLVAVDDPELDPLFEQAAELGMPVALHTGDPRAFWKAATADNERFDELVAHPGWSYHRANVPSWDELLAAHERRIARHPRTTFISVHFGNAAEDPDRVSTLLDRYPNLYVDTAARLPELGRHPAEKLRALFERHQDRILFGTDVGVGPAPGQSVYGSGGQGPTEPADEARFFRATWRYFETSDRGLEHPTPIQGRWTIDGLGLPPGVLRKLYTENAVRVLGLDRRNLAP